MKLFDRPGSTREFLYSKTELTAQMDRREKISKSALAYILKEFPDILYGPAFTHSAMKAVKNIDQFSATVMRVDDEKTSGKNAKAAIGKKALKIVDDFANKNKVIWGILSEGILGAFFPGIEQQDCVSLSKSLQHHLTVKNAETITIGIATYPTLKYEKHHILDNARKALDHASFFGPNSTVVFDSVSLNISGDNRYKEGDIKGAIKEYKRALQIDPSNVNVHNSLGVCHGVLKQYKKAMTSFKNALNIDPKEAMAIYNAGLVHMLKGRREKALESFHKANALSPDVFEIAFHIGKCHLDSKAYETAIAYFNKAIAIQPDSALALSSLGQCYTALNLADQAINAFQSAIKKNPNDAESLSGLGYFFELQDENSEIATLFCEQSIAISPENGLYHHRLGRLYFKQNRLDDALKAFRMASELGHDSDQFIQDIQQRQNDATSS